MNTEANAPADRIRKTQDWWASIENHSDADWTTLAGGLRNLPRTPETVCLMRIAANDELRPARTYGVATTLLWQAEKNCRAGVDTLYRVRHTVGCRSSDRQPPGKDRAVWLHVPTTSRSAPEPQDSTWPSNSLCQALARSCTWRGNSRQPQSWRRVLRRAQYLTRLSGLTCTPSTLARGVDSWTASLAASRAKATVSPDGGCSKPTNAISGPPSGDWLVRWEHGSSSWKTSRASLFQAATSEAPPMAFSKTLRKAGGMRNGYVYPRPVWEPPIDASDGSLWPASKTVDAAGTDYSCYSWGDVLNLSGATKQWQTPNAANVESRRQVGGTTREMLLGGQAKQWTTPRASTGGADPDGGGEGRRGANLQRQTTNWTTPQAHDSTERGRGQQPCSASGNARTWQTPMAADTGEKVTVASAQAGLIGAINDFHCSPPAPTTPDGPTSSPPTRRLNPRFVEWLMGWPVGWTSLAPTDSDSQAMALYRSKLRSLFESLLQE